jgi:hypothetical protein
MKIISAFIVVVLTVLFVAAIFAVPTMLLVNYLFTPAALLTLFGSVKLGFWQALALNVVTGVLFRSSSK